MQTKELLTIEFRYMDKPKSEYFSGHETKRITIGIYDTLEEAIEEGNKVINTLSKTFEVRHDDKFKLKYLFGYPDRLVTNTCYPTNKIQYFAKITKLSFDNLEDTINEAFKAGERYKEFKNSEQYED